MRAFLHILLPLLLPFLLWLLWVVVTYGKQPPNWWNRAPWPWLAGAGVVLMVGSLFTWALLGGDAPGGYEPPRWDGEGIVPGRVTQ